MANDKMLELAEAEVKRLQAELEKTPAYKRLRAAQNLIAEYRGNPEVVAAAPTLAVPAAAVGTPQAPIKATRVIPPDVERVVDEMIDLPYRTKTAQIEAAVVEYLVHRGRRATSGELLPVVQAKGIAITGKLPSKTLSSYLSNSKRFDNVPGFGGYGLVEWGGRRTAPAAGTPNEIIHDGGKLSLNS